MSHLIKHRHFIRLLLDPQSTKKQKQAILDLSSKAQIKAILEIAYNLKQGIVALEPDTEAYIKKRSWLLRKLLNSDTPHKDIYTYSKAIVDLLEKIRSPLESLLL